MADVVIGPEQVINKAITIIGRLTLEKALAEDHIDHLVATGLFPEEPSPPEPEATDAEPG